MKVTNMTTTKPTAPVGLDAPPWLTTALGTMPDWLPALGPCGRWNMTYERQPSGQWLIVALEPLEGPYARHVARVDVDPATLSFRLRWEVTPGRWVVEFVPPDTFVNLAQLGWSLRSEFDELASDNALLEVHEAEIELEVLRSREDPDN